jgi:hypothetical protein
MRTFLAIAAAVAVSTLAPGAFAQPPPPDEGPPAERASQASPRLDTGKEKVSLGFDLMRLQDDFGVGGTLSSPTLVHWIRLTMGGGIAWYPHGIAANGNETWDMFGHGRLVVEVGPTFQKGIPVRPYAFGGASTLILPSSLSATQLRFGGVGGFGLELAFMYGERSGPDTFYMEIGGCGFGASADKLPTNPDVASGLLLNAGFRAYL